MQAADLRALDTQGWTPEVQVEVESSILGKLRTLDPKLEVEGDDGFGGRYTKLQDRNGVIGKVMADLAAPGIIDIVETILKPRDETQVPADAGAYWPGKIWDQQLAEGGPPRLRSNLPEERKRTRSSKSISWKCSLAVPC